MSNIEHDGCVGCKYIRRHFKDEPCKDCSGNHPKPNEYSDFYEHDDDFVIMPRQDIKVNICGIPHKIIEKEDAFNADSIHFGQINYKECEILISKDMTEESKKETICHEMIHGILVHLGFDELSQDEKLVQALGNAIYNSFDIKEF